MRSSLIISLVLHLLVMVIAIEWVSFREVKYVPRDVYQVQLVAPVQAQPAKTEPPPPPKEEKPPPEPEPEPIPEPEPDKPINPVPKKKVEKKPEKKPVQREVPRDIEKTSEQKPDETADQPPAETGAVQLDSDFPFGYYINRIRRKVAAQWRVPMGSQGEDRGCRVYFRVYRDGRVSNVNVEESSGLFMFDQAAERAVLAASPMPPLPREFRDDFLGVHFTFAYREEGP